MGTMSDAWGSPPSGGGWQGGGQYPDAGGHGPQGAPVQAPDPIRGRLFDDGAATGYPPPPPYERSAGERRSTGRRSAEQPEPTYVPEQRGAAAGGAAAGGAAAGEGAGSAADGRAQRRRGSTAVSQELRRPAALSVAVLIGLPLVAGMISGGGGLVLDIGAVLGAGIAAALCSRPGAWWVSTATPPVVLLMALAGFFVRDSSSTTGKFATNMAKCVAGAFPAMGAALAVAVVVGVARLVAARRGR